MKRLLLILFVAMSFGSLVSCSNTGDSLYSSSGGSNPFLPSGGVTVGGVPGASGSSSGSTAVNLTDTDKQLNGTWISQQYTQNGDRVILAFHNDTGERKVDVQLLQLTGKISSQPVSTGTYELSSDTLIFKLLIATYQGTFKLATNPESLTLGTEKYTRLQSILTPSLSGQIIIDQQTVDSTVKVTSAPEFSKSEVLVKYKQGSTQALTVGGEASSPYGVIKIQNNEPTASSLQALALQSSSVSDLVDQVQQKQAQREKDFWQQVKILQADPTIEQVGYNYLLKAQGTSDLIGSQDYLNKTSVPAAWEIIEQQGKKSGAPVVVAVIDTGIRADHEDLKDRILLQQGYDFVEDTIPGEVTNLDLDDVMGGDNKPGPDHDPTDPGDLWKLTNESDGNSWHGTHVAGIIAAIRDNKSGISGIATAATSQQDAIKVLPLRVLGYKGDGTTTATVNAIKYAIDQPHVKVINLSLGHAMPENSLAAKMLVEVIKKATDKGILVVTAAGNDNTAYPSSCKDADGSTTTCSFYPAASENALAVAGTNPAGTGRWVDSSNKGSNYGDYVDIAAPGEAILSTTWKKASGSSFYDKYSGTSQAAPQVSAVAALLFSQKPTLTVSDVKKVLQGTAFQATKKDKYLGYGLMNAYQAVIKGLSLTPPPQPLLNVNVSTMDLADQATQSPITLSNNGGQSLSITALQLSGFQPSLETKWISLVLGNNPMQAGTLNPAYQIPQAQLVQLMVKVNRAGLKAGAYMATLKIQSDGGDKTITIAMTVNAAQGGQPAGASDVNGLIDQVKKYLASKKDTDGDGVYDPTDNCPAVENKSQNDQDQDKIGDACDDDVDGDGKSNDEDNCSLVINPDQKDSDQDGVGDVCQGDYDGDGFKDPVDNCPDAFNKNQSDQDNDTIGDVCDDDQDGDGSSNDEDTCPLVANPDQKDTDGDGIGDLCQTDQEGDGISDTDDNCKVVPNTDQKDTDGDGVGDVCQGDDNGDGVPDSEAVTEGGNPDGTEDGSDGDGGDASHETPGTNTVNIGTFCILLIDIKTDKVAPTHACTDINSDYYFQILNIPLGTYKIVAGVDSNQNGYICDDGEPCIQPADTFTIDTNTVIPNVQLHY